jgi:hypothetical protein
MTRVLAYTPTWDVADSVAGDVVVVGQLRHAAGSLPQGCVHQLPPAQWARGCTGWRQPKQP